MSTLGCHCHTTAGSAGSRVLWVPQKVGAAVGNSPIDRSCVGRVKHVTIGYPEQGCLAANRTAEPAAGPCIATCIQMAANAACRPLPAFVRDCFKPTSLQERAPLMLAAINTSEAHHVMLCCVRCVVLRYAAPAAGYLVDQFLKDVCALSAAPHAMLCCAVPAAGHLVDQFLKDVCA